MLSSSERTLLATEMSQYRQEIASRMAEQMLQIEFWRLHFGEEGQAICINNNLNHLDLFISGVRHDSLSMAEEQVNWLRSALVEQGFCTSYLVQNLIYMQQVTAEYTSPAALKTFDIILKHALNMLQYRDVLSQEVLKREDEIINKVVDKIYSTARYWQARYGDKGRSNCLSELHYSLAHLLDALALNTIKGTLIYTKRRQDVLLSTGMCSEYYLTLLMMLIKELSNSLPQISHARVQDWLTNVENSLRYDEHFEGLLLTQAPAIIERCAMLHYDQSPALQARWERSEYQTDIFYRLSYLIDALCQYKPDLFHDYLLWQQKNLASLALTPSEFERDLKIFAEALPLELPAVIEEWLDPKKISTFKANAIPKVQLQTETASEQSVKIGKKDETYQAPLSPQLDINIDIFNYISREIASLRDKMLHAFYSHASQLDLQKVIEDFASRSTNLQLLISEAIYSNEINKTNDQFGLIDLADLINSLIITYAGEAERQSILLSVEISELLPQIRADSEALNRALVLMLEHALNHTSLHGQVELGAVQVDESWVKIFVRNTGPMLTNKSLASKMVPQFSQRGQLYGLGLALLKPITIAHGGTLLTKQGNKFNVLELRLPINGPIQAVGNRVIPQSKYSKAIYNAFNAKRALPV